MQVLSGSFLFAKEGNLRGGNKFFLEKLTKKKRGGGLGGASDGIRRQRNEMLDD